MSKVPSYVKCIEGLRCFDRVREMLVRGWGLSKVVKYVRSEGEGSFVSDSTLKTYLRKYRDHQIPKSTQAAEALPSVHQRAAEEIEEGLDVLKELQGLYEMQKERIKIDFDIEQNINKLLKGTHREVREAREILSVYADVQADLGLTRRQLGEVTIRHQEEEEEDKSLADPETRQRVISFYRRMQKLGADEDSQDLLRAIDVTPEEGG